MTFPTLVGITGYVLASPGTSFAVFSGVSVARGSIAIVAAGDQDTTLSTASTGWQLLGQSDDDNGSGTASAIFKATADNTALTVASTETNRMSALLVRITGGGTVSGTALAESSNPPNHSIGSARDAMWIAAAITENDAPSSAPSGYSGFTTQSGSSAPAVAAAYRTNAASSENPGAFGSGGTYGVVWTIALYTRRKIRAGGTI